MKTSLCFIVKLLTIREELKIRKQLPHKEGKKTSYKEMRITFKTSHQ